MRKAEISDIADVLTSDLCNDAMVVWVYLRIKPQGVGDAGLKRAFKVADVDWQLGIEVLEELGMCERATLHHGGTVYRAMTPEAADKVTRVTLMVDAYKAWREGHGIPARDVSERDWERMRELEAWLSHNGVDFTEYLEHTHHIYRHIKQVGIIQPSHLAGPYARDQWLNAADRKRKRPGSHKEHAGTGYRPTKGIRRELKSIGVDTKPFNDSEIRYIDDMVKVMDEDHDVILPDEYRTAILSLRGSRAVTT